jgi:hypothetical protein
MTLQTKTLAENIYKCCDKITELEGYISNAKKAIEMWNSATDLYDNVRHNESNIRRYESMILLQKLQIQELIKQLNESN